MTMVIVHHFEFYPSHILQCPCAEMENDSLWSMVIMVISRYLPIYIFSRYRDFAKTPYVYNVVKFVYLLIKLATVDRRIYQS